MNLLGKLSKYIVCKKYLKQDYTLLFSVLKAVAKNLFILNRKKNFKKIHL